MYTKSIIKIILSILIIILIGDILPWWWFSIITLIIGYISSSSKESIINGFLIGFMCWFIMLVYLFNNAGNDQIFSKMSMLLLGKNSPIQLIIYTSLISGIIGLLSSWVGWQFNNKGK